MLAVLQAHALRAQQVLPPDVHAWIADGGPATAEAEAAWSALRLRPHVLRDVATVDTSLTLLGTPLATPVLVGPTAAHGKAHPAGESETYRGARAAGAWMVWSMRADQPVSGPCWWQAYVLRDRAVTRDAALLAKDSGATAVVLTGDTPYLGTARRPALGELDQDPSVTLDAIGWLADLTGLPVLVKGVLRADDAEECLRAGAAGIVVSNHGGRQLDRAVTTASALPQVVDAVAGRVPVLVDGGLRSGVDVLCALALGASAVLLGKPVLWALAAEGAAGVEGCLRAVTDDLALAMGLAGCASLADVDRSLVTGSVELP